MRLTWVSLLFALTGCPVAPRPPDKTPRPDLTVVFDFTFEGPIADVAVAASDLTPIVSDDGGSNPIDAAVLSDFTASPIDTAAPPDFTSPKVDQAVPPDLTITAKPDASIPPDLLVATVDTAVAQDLTVPPKDLTAVDLACSTNCMTPPPATCQKNVVYSYNSPGTCTQGMCVYPSNTAGCPNGCYGGKCNTQQLNFLGNCTATIATSGMGIALDGATVPAASGVDLYIQTYPPGSAAFVYVSYQLNNPMVPNGTDLLMTYNGFIANNDAWKVTIPPIAANNDVWWYIRAIAYDGTTTLYYSNLSKNFHYHTN